MSRRHKNARLARVAGCRPEEPGEDQRAGESLASLSVYPLSSSAVRFIHQGWLIQTATIQSNLVWDGCTLRQELVAR